MLRSLRVFLSIVALGLSLAGSVRAACPNGDLTDDCRVDFNDVKFMADRWLDPPGSPADIFGGGGVNWGDFAALANNWGAVGDATGSLRVSISPLEVIVDGAQWRVDGGLWRDKGTTASDLTVGPHTVDFADVPGWTKPGSEVVQISEGELKDIEGTYTRQLGSLRVDIGPADAVAAGAQWRVDGGSWRGSGATVGNLYAGSHTVEFKEVGGWVSAALRTVIVNGGLTTSITGTYSQPLVISEFLASNRSRPPLEEGDLLDEDGQSSDWIEIYNPTDIAIDLGGWHLTNSDSNLAKWEFPPGVTLESGEFLVVFASNKNRRDPNHPLHTSFELDRAPMYLALVGRDGFSVVHAYSPQYPDQLPNVSYGLAQGATKLLDTGATASYYVPTASDATKDWTAVDFPDAVWPKGKTSIGFGNLTVGSGVNYEYYEGNWSWLPDFDSLTPVSEGTVEDFDITPRRQNDYFGFRFSGSIEITTAGTYTFYTASDDGSQLFIDGGLVVNNDGLHSMQEMSGSIYLTAGMHPITVTFFEGSIDDGLIVSYSGPGISKMEIPGSVLWIGPATNVEAQMKTVNASLWVRMEFNLEEGEAATFDSLALRMKYEDGYAAYLNGQLVAWDNAPSPLSWNSAALSDRRIEDSATFTSANLMPYLGQLRVGKNVLAIHALNDNKNNSEFLLLPELVCTSGSEAYQYFMQRTPGKYNVTGAMGVTGEVWFSHERGFYSSPFDLTLSTETYGSEIRYTKDGSTPTASHGNIYAAGSPIRIDKTTALRAVAVTPGYLDSEVMTHTYIFVSDVIRQSPNGEAPGPNWPTGSVNGQTMNYGMDKYIVNHATWGPLVDDALLAIPSISLVTDLPNLFDEAEGIYVHAGDHGRDWERPASIELINPDGSDGFHINAGVRIRGGYSRSGGNPKHAFRLFFRSEYGEANLNFPLFGDEGAEEFDKVDLRTAQNYSWSYANDPANTMCREVWARDSQGLMGQPYTRSRYYHLYIDGQYWGLYQTQERAEASYAATYLGGKSENYDTVKATGPNGGYTIEATDGTLDAWRALWDLANLGFKNHAVYSRALGLNPNGTRNPSYPVLLDVDNIIDYMIMVFFDGDRDAPISWFLGNNNPNNWFGVRDRTGEEGFKYFVHDAEHIMSRGLTDRTGPYPAGDQFQHSNPQWIHQGLMGHPDYRLQFADHAYKHLLNNGLLTASQAIARFRARANQIDMAIIAESARWGSSSLNKTTWQSAVNNEINSFFPNRATTILNQLRIAKLRDGTVASLYPSILAPSFSHPGGEVPKGQTLTMSASSGKIYYTKDGSDPRLTVAQSGAGSTVTLVAENAAKRVLVPTGPVTSTTGSIQYEYWMGIGGGAVWNLTSQPDFPGNPDGTSSRTSFEAPTNWAEDYGARISGYVHPPQTGDYRFWICSDDNSELWLSYDENPANATRIAFEDSWADSRNWQTGNEQSAYISLQAGRKYYIEALMAEGWGGDNLAVTWSGPGVTYGVPILGTHLSPPALPDTWTKPNFNHSSWPSYASGKRGVGYERSPSDPVNFTDLIDINVESGMYGINQTCYIRIPFTVSVLDLTRLTLKVRYDEGFVAYINGSKVASGNFTGTPQWNSGADSDRADSAAREFVSIDISEHIGKLLAGNNILAVQGLNYTKNSPDFLISVELTAAQMGQGDVSPGATQYTGPITIDKSMVVKARVLDGAWSPLHEATYAVGPVAESLRITEIMHHPQETGDLEDPNKEFIELRNIGPSAINLNLVRFTKGIDFTFPNINLSSGGYVVVIAKRSAFEARYPGFSGVIAGEYTGRLDNAGERIRLEDAIGRTIHDFEYKDGWRSITDGEGFSLTMIDPTDPPSGMPEDGLVAHWKFDEGSGTTATDSAGSNNGTIRGGAAWTTGRIGGALRFDGSNDDVSFAPVSTLAGNSVTVSCWVRLSGLTGVWNPVLTQSNAAGDGYYLYIYEDKPTFSLIGGGGAVQAVGSENILWNEWYQLAGTNDGSNLRIYVDGVLKGSGSSVGKTGVSVNAYVASASGAYFSGLLDDVRIYNRALSEYEFGESGDPLDRWGQKDWWRASAYVGGSPGWDDSGIIPNPGAIVINEVLAHSHGVAADWIELYNTTNAQVNVGGWYLSDSAADLKKYRIADGKKINAYGYVVFREDANFGQFATDPGRVTGFAFSENGDEVYLSSAEAGVLTGYREVEDFGASYTGVSFGRYFKRSTGNYNFVSMDHITPGWANAYPKVGPIVINEIMYNPQSGDQKQEFVELRNIGPAAVTLYDFNEAEPWKFTSGIDYTFDGYPGVTVPAGGYVLIVPDVAAYIAKYGMPPAGVIMLGAYDGKLSNSGEKLELSMPGDIDEFGSRHYIRADRVDYSDGSHPADCPGGVDLWPTGPDGGGASLSRVTAQLYSNDPNNWAASSPPTPGR